MIRTFRPIPLKKIKLVIFDLDGTLVDSELDLATSVNDMLRHFGRKELPIQVIGTYIGDGAPMLIRRALGDPVDRTFLQTALTYFLASYHTHKLDNTCPYEGIKEALEQIGGGERRLAVLTNKPVRASQGILAGIWRQQLRNQEARPLGANSDVRSRCDSGRNGDRGRLRSGHPYSSQCWTVERRRYLWLRPSD